MSIIEELTQPTTGPIVAAAITGLVSINTLFLKWLIDSFSSLRDELKRVTLTTQLWLRDHETKDQTRHEENLKRFETIAVSLATVSTTTQDLKNGEFIRHRIQ